MRQRGRNNSWRISRLGAGAALVAGALGSGLVSAPARAAELKAGQRMPTFTLATVEGKRVSLAGFKNRAVWLVFFHST